MKVLVTGGAGFIGSHIVDKLIKNNYQVLVFDNLASGKKEYIHSKAKLIVGDITNPYDVKNVFRRFHFDTVFHIAGQASIIASYDDPFSDMQTNLLGTMNIVSACLTYKVQRMLYASSMTVYGNVKKIPIKEDTQCMPINYYGIAKYAAERFIHTTAERIDLPTPFFATSFRMFNVYGPRQSLTNPYQGVLAIFMGNVIRGEPIKIFGDGKQSRDFVYVDDVTDVWIQSINNKESYNRVFNVGYGKKTSILKLAKHVIKAFGYSPATYPIIFEKNRSGDQQFVQSDITRAKRDLNYHPKYALDKGLKKTLLWATNHNE